jgi:predicted ABC-type ATPase
MPCLRNIAQLRREKIAGRFVYFSSDKATYARQEQKRKEDDACLKLTKLPTDAEAVIVLVELIKCPELSVEQLCIRLNKKGHGIKGEIIQNLFARHGLLKKTMDIKR